MLKRIRALFGKKNRKPADPSSAPARGSLDLERPAVHIGPRVVHRPIPVADLDPDAVKIIRRLTRFDHTAYLVGGCVRDLLLERRPKDFDIGTSATPRQIKRVFRNSRIIGRRFRLAHIYFQNRKVIEVATFRTRDVEDSEGPPDRSRSKDLLIRDDNVFGTPEDDALRRDFTVNALFYDVNDETVLDHADGLGDLRRRYVRAIGDPEIRFREDPIRILRAIRFAARLDFEIEPKTLAALRHHKLEVPKAATARTLEEINRYCRGGAARRSFELLDETGVFEVILPEFHERYHANPAAWSRLLQSLETVDRRLADGREASTGEILTLMILPLIAESIGWNADGAGDPPSGVDMRRVADRFLDPLATRLHVPRKEQERCRQILITLSRMVPAESAGRTSRRSILGRECLPEALWILEDHGRREGGRFAEASKHWREAANRSAGEASRRPGGTGQAAAQADAGDESVPRTGRRRRRRRRSRSTPPPGGGPPDKQPDKQRDKQPDKQTAKRPDLPSPWDDRYFFAALPTVPASQGDDVQGDEVQGDRYGASTVATPAGRGEEPPTDRDQDRVVADAEADADADAENGPPGDEAETPERRPKTRRRRRSRGRRRGPKRNGEPTGDSE